MSDSIKSQFVDDIILRASVRLSREQVNFVQTLLWIGLKDYDMTAASKDLTTYDVSNGTILKRFLANKMLEGCSEKTIAFYRIVIRQYMEKCSKPVIQTEVGDVKAHLAVMMTSGNSLTSCDNHRRILAVFFAWLNDEGLISNNPMRRVKKIKQPKILKQAFSYTDMERIRMSCKSVRDRAIVEVLLSTACRASEITGAKLTDLHLSEGTLKVLGKGRKERIVYLNAAAKVWLGRYLSERTDTVNTLFLSARKKNGCVNPLTTQGLENIVRKLGAAAGVEHCHPHRFRRTAATWASRKGMKLEQIQQMLGHEQIATTTIYTSVAQKDVQIAHERYLGGD